MTVTTVAVTGASGFLGQGLLRQLGGTGFRLVGLDVREPEFRPPEFRFHLVDVARSDLAPLLEDVDVLVHLAGIHDAIPDERLMLKVNVTGTRRVLEAAGAVGVEKLVVMSSATVYGAWSNNPIPLNEDAPLRPNRGFPLAVQKAEVERLLAEWAPAHPGVVVTVLRPAFVLGPRANHLVARMVSRPGPLVLAGSAGPVQFVHEDDVASALALVIERDLPGAFNVAADGWLSREEFDGLLGRRLRAPVPPPVAEAALRRLWPAGLADLPPGALPYLVHSWVVANDRLRAEGWLPDHSNEDAVLASVERRPTISRAGALAAGAMGAGLGLAAAIRLVRRPSGARAR
jgi:nucleoside-diphosphate-sugar epimerase